MIFLAHTPRRRKPERSAHQKQIRFLTGLAMAVGLLLFAAVFWYFNHSGFIASAR
jgi:hypothetical protein